MSENTASNSGANCENVSPANPTPVPQTQPDESKFTPEQIRKALEPLFRDLNQVLRQHGVESVEIVAFTTAFVKTEITDVPPSALQPYIDLISPHIAMDGINDGSPNFVGVDELEGEIGQVSIAEIFAVAQNSCHPRCVEQDQHGNPTCVACR